MAEITDEQIDQFVEDTKDTRKRVREKFDYVGRVYEAYKQGDSGCEDILKKFVLISTLTVEEIQKLDRFCRAHGYLPALHSMPTDIQNYKRTFYINYEDEG